MLPSLRTRAFPRGDRASRCSAVAHVRREDAPLDLPPVSQQERAADDVLLRMRQRRGARRLGIIVMCEQTKPWIRGAEVVVPMRGTEKWGRIIAGPKGRHRVFLVACRDGDRLLVPEVLLLPPHPS